ncbi:glycosyltransferase family 4 protein [Aliivibrio finisterrensis]|uniref:glycosyltransferase family 4 protein n=1 Tax=Aliivibrio finisterrensis TaxID=511998 RepID=UPI001F5DED48|nr:glycosyltransferase family 4 protein [Aliivibrio finisterrensis]
MKKIAYFVNVDWFFVSHRLPIALAAIKEGYEVHLICSITDKKNMLEQLGIIVHALPVSRSGMSIQSEIRTITKLFSLMNMIQPDVLHCVTIKPVIYGNLVGRVLGIPKRVSSISGLGFVFIAKGIKSALLKMMVSILYRIALNNSYCVIFQNISDRDLFREMKAVSSSQELIIRGSGVYLDKYPVTTTPQGTPIVMLLARLLIDKGVNEFVAAAKVVNQTHKKARMVLVGDVDLDNPKSISSTQLDKWVEEGIVEHWGYANNVPEVIAQSTLMVLPSYREGLPKSLIEAAACGRAVITTDVPGCRDAIEPNVTGLLVPVKSVEPLAKAINRLIDDSVLRLKFAENGRNLAQSEFDIQDVVNTHIEIYSK